MSATHSLKKLTDYELETQLKVLVGKERQLLHLTLNHIKEVDSRKLYLERAYPSLYEYMTKELKYSGSAAMRRIEAARLLRDIPAISNKIQEGVLNLSQIGELSRAVKEKEKSGVKVSALQKQNLLEKISSKTTQETQKELAQALDLPIKDYDSQRFQKDESVRLEITLTKEQYEMLTRCKDLASHSLSQQNLSSSWADVLQIVMGQYLKPNTKALHAAASASVVNKTLTAKTKRAILQRDRGCQFKDPKTGKQCQSTYLLQVDHKRPQWASGDHSIENLQALCGVHNQMKYRKEAGLVG